MTQSMKNMYTRNMETAGKNSVKYIIVTEKTEKFIIGRKIEKLENVKKLLKKETVEGIEKEAQA